MARVGVISIDLVAHTGKLLKPLQRANAAVSRIGNAIKRVASLMATVVAPLVALGAGFAAAAVSIGAVKRQFSEVDKIAKTADKLGLTTEALIGLQHAAELGGVGADTFNMAVQRMTRRISEAANGSGEAVKALQELGLNAEDLKLAGPEAALGMVADKLDEVGNASDRVRLAFKLFDSEGVNMVNVLRGGSDALNKAKEDADKLGITLNRTDARKIEMANDAMTRLRQLLTGIARKVAVELAPYIKLAADYFVELGTRGDGWGTIIQTAIQKAIGAFGSLLNGIQTVLQKITSGILYVVTPIETVINAIGTAMNWVVAQLQHGITAGFTALVSFGAGVLQWLDSVLPERFQTGLGNVAQQYANELNKIADQQQKSLESKDYQVKLDLTSGTQNMLDALGGEKWGDRLQRRVDEIAAKAAGIAENVTSIPELDQIAADGSDVTAVGALLKGSQEAFKAIVGTREKDKSLEIQTKQYTELQGIRRAIENGNILLGADL